MATCTQCSAPFEVTDEDLAFYDKVSPVFNGKKELIPPPTQCPNCRQQRRWLFQNQRFLYRRTSDATGKEILSSYSSEKPVKVYERDLFLEKDNTDVGRDFDFNRSFFEQFHDLTFDVIKPNVLQAGEMLNSEYTHFVGWMKNCYLLFDAGKNEDCMYSVFMGYNKNCIDCSDLQINELCYDAVDLTDCYQTAHLTFCKNCSFSAFLFDCIGCRNCIGCVNLRNKENYIFNKPVTPEEFQAAWKALFNGSFQTTVEAQAQWETFALQCPRRPVHNINTQYSSGDYLIDCDHAEHCYKSTGCHDCKYCQYAVLKNEDCYDISSFGENMEFCYSMSASGGLLNKTSISRCAFGVYIYYGGREVYYSMECADNCQYLFGCSNLRGKKYCILNKQYTKEEYEDLVPKIIQHMRETEEWGEFFPASLSHYGYNETVAQDNFPLSKEQALAKGYAWKEDDPREYQPATITLPDSTYDTPDTLTKEILACTRCRKNYKCIPQELEFYRAQGLPIPRLCIDCRYLQRLARRNPQTLWDRQCANCHQPIQTSYSPDRPEIVYCEDCYKKEVY